MNINEEIYQEVQRLPESMAREVLEFIDYLKKRQGLRHEPGPDYNQAHPGSVNAPRVSSGDEVWNDLLFGQSRFDAVTVNKALRSPVAEAEAGER